MKAINPWTPQHIKVLQRQCDDSDAKAHRFKNGLDQ